VGIALLVALAVPVLLQSVFIAPHAVFIDEKTGGAQVTLGAGDAAEEVTVDLAFGYPDVNPDGMPYLHMVDDPGDEFPSAAEWIRAFPRRVRLEPGDRRTLRLLATPPADLADGEYWARLIVTARGATTPVASTDTTVRAGLDIVFRLIVPVTYRRGAVSTGVALQWFEAAMEDDSLVAWMGVDRFGNAAFLGTAEFTVLDDDGTALRDWAIPMGIYYQMDRRFVFHVDDLPSGSYRLALRLAAERKDLEDNQVLPAAPVGDTVAFVVP